MLTNILWYNVYFNIETSISISLYGDFFPFSLMNVPFLLQVPMLSLTTHLPERDIYKKTNLIIENIYSNNYLKSLYSLKILAMNETFHIDNNQMYKERGKLSVRRQLQGRGAEHGCEREDRYKRGITGLE